MEALNKGSEQLLLKCLRWGQAGVVRESKPLFSSVALVMSIVSRYATCVPETAFSQEKGQQSRSHGQTRVGGMPCFRSPLRESPCTGFLEPLKSPIPLESQQVSPICLSLEKKTTYSITSSGLRCSLSWTFCTWACEVDVEWTAFIQ